jgi:hypothetical protein
MLTSCPILVSNQEFGERVATYWNEEIDDTNDGTHAWRRLIREKVLFRLLDSCVSRHKLDSTRSKPFS